MLHTQNNYGIILSIVFLIGFSGIVISMLFSEIIAANADEYIGISTNDDESELICNVDVTTVYYSSEDIMQNNNTYGQNMLSLFASQNIGYFENSHKISQIVLSATGFSWENGTEALNNKYIKVGFNNTNLYHSLAKDVVFVIDDDNLKTVQYFVDLQEESGIDVYDLEHMSADITLMTTCD